MITTVANTCLIFSHGFHYTNFLEAVFAIQEYYLVIAQPFPPPTHKKKLAHPLPAWGVCRLTEMNILN